MIYYKKALVIFDNEKKPAQTATCIDNMSLIFKQKGDFLQARSYNLRGYKSMESLHISIGMLASMGNLGRIFIVQKNTNNAIEILQ